MPEPSTKYRTLDFNGKQVRFATIGELAWACGKRSKHTFYKLIESGVLPEANYRLPRQPNKHGQKSGEVMAGTRLYSVDVLMPKLVSIFATIRQGVQITHDQRNALQLAFAAEREEVANL